MGRTSIVVVSYNHRAFIAECVRALERADLPPGTRLILIDNASGDGTADRIRAELLAPGEKRTRGGLEAFRIREIVELAK